jgi:hypothetical protein
MQRLSACSLRMMIRMLTAVLNCLSLYLGDWKHHLASLQVGYQNSS